MRVLALDFDGVLCDSSREVFLVAVDAYALQEPDSPLLRRLTELRDDAADGGNDHLDDPLVQAFAGLLPLGNRAEDFGVALRALETEVSIGDQDAYDSFYACHEQVWLESYHRLFYEARARLRAEDPAAWSRLHLPYPGLADILGRHADDTHLAVVTAKDGRSVHLLLEELEMAEIFGADLILDKETGVEKTHHLQVLRDRLGADFSDITFVDDKVNHLEQVAGLGVRPVLAGWGFNTQREHTLARSLGYEIAFLGTADAVLFKGD